jgi:hypothetical protein
MHVTACMTSNGVLGHTYKSDLPSAAYLQHNRAEEWRQGGWNGRWTVIWVWQQQKRRRRRGSSNGGKGVAAAAPAAKV